MPKILKTIVTTGVQYLEIPEADLRILCSSPADAVKHLMRRGLINAIEKQGVPCENGPNAILLSDLMLQNGVLSNLSEFPVLQMLYRQGMLIPGHPNNTGQKPLIMGAEEQVRAQLNYIYRGNYGLVSLEELLAAGVPRQLAEQLMAVKLYFSFGEIRPTEKLVDTLVIGRDPVEIRQGVTVRRVAVNRFEFSYQGETASVDLRLQPGEVYKAPYHLGMHRIEREYFSVIHSGEGDGWDVHRPSMSSVLIYQGLIYLIDAGPSVISSLTALGIGVNEVEGIFQTHGHDDHFSGLVELIRGDRRIKFFTTPMVRASVTKKLCALLSMEEGSFGDYFEIRDLTMDQWTDLGGLEVMPMLSLHPVETNIFTFRALGPEGYKTYAHLADIASDDVINKMSARNGRTPSVARKLVDHVKEGYLQEVDLKKIDIGGGMIHGSARDFRNDRSRKIILAHTNRDLNDEQKAIGSGSPYGTVDVLIPRFQNYVRRIAFARLRDYFPDVPQELLNVLLNNDVLTFNPESILIREGFTNDSIYLILTGSVEMLQLDQEGGTFNLSSGALVGEQTGLHGLPALETYRAKCFVRALDLPCVQYLEFVKKHELYADIALLEENREYLRKTWLFGEGLSQTTLNHLAKVMKVSYHPAGERIENRNENGLLLVKTGGLRRHGASAGEADLEPGSFFGFEQVLGEGTVEEVYEATAPTNIYHIPRHAFTNLPIVRWKLFEYSRRRAAEK